MFISSLIQTVTVGFGITPNQPVGSQTFTAGQELHLAPKIAFHGIYSVYSLGGLPEKSAMVACAFAR